MGSRVPIHDVCPSACCLVYSLLVTLSLLLQFLCVILLLLVVSLLALPLDQGLLTLYLISCSLWLSIVTRFLTSTACVIVMSELLQHMSLSSLSQLVPPFLNVVITH